MTLAAAVETLTAVEVLHGSPETARATAALAAFARAARGAGLRITTTTQYAGAAPFLLVWGPGAPDRAAAMRQHVTAGGHVLALDLAYWHRDRKVRISIDAPHPQAWVMRRDLSDRRWRQDRPPVANLWNPDGPIVVAGIGQKATVQYGADVVEAWQSEMIAACRGLFGTRQIMHRPKTSASAPPIDVALRGAALVITWHSNVAVDAIRLGIPVVCRDGAASAVCPSTVPAQIAPLSTDVRDRFLANLAWFQWAPEEAADGWAFVREALACA